MAGAHMEGSWTSLRLNAIIIKDNGVSDGKFPSTTELPSQLAPFYRVPVVAQPTPPPKCFWSSSSYTVVHPSGARTKRAPFPPRIRRTTCVCFYVFFVRSNSSWGRVKGGCVRTYFQTIVSR